jgi:hypothetical protein
MNTSRAFQIVGTSAAVAGCVGASIALGAGSSPKITAKGAGAVHIGDTYKSLRSRGLVEKIQPSAGRTRARLG